MRQECKNRGHIVAAANPLGLPLAVGQTVEVETSRSELLRQALQALVPPLTGFLGGFMLTGLFFPRGGESFRVAGGLAALFAAAGITYLARKRFPSSALPRVTEIRQNPR
jgi:positive regulator of sigma E activity